MCIASIALVKMPYLLFSFILHETTLVFYIARFCFAMVCFSSFLQKLLVSFKNFLWYSHYEMAKRHLLYN